MAETIRVRGTGGAEFDIDNPYADHAGGDSSSREVMREQIEKGQLFIVGDDEDSDAGDNGSQTPLPPPSGDSEPSRGASRDLWVTFALSKGAKPEDLEDLKRDELVERFGTPAS